MKQKIACPLCNSEMIVQPTMAEDYLKVKCVAYDPKNKCGFEGFYCTSKDLFYKEAGRALKPGEDRRVVNCCKSERGK